MSEIPAFLTNLSNEITYGWSEDAVETPNCGSTFVAYESDIIGVSEFGIMQYQCPKWSYDNYDASPVTN